MADPAAAASQGTSSAPSPALTSSSATSDDITAAAASPFIFGTAPSAHSGASPPSHFAPLFSSPPASMPSSLPPAPRHPIFLDSIQNHIKFLLNPDDHNYHKWKLFFLLVLIRYGVAQFIEQPLPAAATPQQREIDAHIVLWIYATLADNLVDHIVGATTTFDPWHRIVGATASPGT
ncbi:hypothetical protein D1007_54508 [Hordeum vulgare]|nr:hypothetical protein D1007_54508 [Hordeum vulgare]